MHATYLHMVFTTCFLYMLLILIIVDFIIPKSGFDGFSL